VYKLEYLPSAVTDILEIDAYLYEYSSAASDKFAVSIERLSEVLALHPLLYPAWRERREEYYGV